MADFGKGQHVLLPLLGIGARGPQHDDGGSGLWGFGGFLHPLPPRQPNQTTSRLPFRGCGMTPTVSRISPLDEPPRPHRAQEEAFDVA
jgi:hypothetical protein